MELKDIIDWVLTIIIAVIGVSTFVVIRSNKNSRNKINQSISNGDGNIQAGGDVFYNSNNKED